MKPFCYLLILFISVQHSYGQLVDTTSHELNTVIVSASKLKEKRKEAPIALSLISNAQLNDIKAGRMDDLLNRVSGVYMPSIGNEQHMMSIRQPISLKGLYLYLEDGMPIRPSGLFSNNALIEINIANVHSIEVIKGPASALYGAEAIGGVIHLLSQAVDTIPTTSFSTQINSLGWKKMDISTSSPSKVGNWRATGSWTEQQNGPMEHSDFSKKAISVRQDYSLSKKWSGYQSIQGIDYYGQMTGSVDSAHFFQKNFSSQQTFTYRKIKAFRLREYWSYQWNSNNTTHFSALYRNNTMDQNPSYFIASTPQPNQYKGQQNKNHFDSYVVDIQQILEIKKRKTKLIIGGYLDYTRQNLMAHYIDIYKDTLIGKFTSFKFRLPDSLLTNYHTNITNKAMYVNVISNISSALRLNIALRYDNFKYLFNNTLGSGTPSSNNYFTNWAPKLGITYNQGNIGSYINYSEGFVPPQITEIYNAVRVPYLLPQHFTNSEIGVWRKWNKVYAEMSLYKLDGVNEIISVRQADGVNLNQNAGKTQHIGVEYQFKFSLNQWLSLHWNATHAQHKYINTHIKGVDVSGKAMNAAPHFFSHLTLHWKPSATWRTNIEWQHQSRYYMDETNTTIYPGFDVVHFRCGYRYKQHEFWMNLLNATNRYYATLATKNFSVKGNAGYAYYIAEPIQLTVGWTWSLTKN